MLDFPRWKRLSIFIGLAIMVALAIPSFFPKSQRDQWPSWIPHPAINLGLDLAGGSYLLLEGDTSGVAQARLEAMKEQVRNDMRRAPRVEIGDISVQDGKVAFMVRDPSQVDAAREKLLPLTNGVGTTGQRDWDIAVVDSTGHTSASLLRTVGSVLRERDCAVWIHGSAYGLSPAEAGKRQDRSVRRLPSGAPLQTTGQDLSQACAQRAGAGKGCRRNYPRGLPAGRCVRLGV
ncbi:MAG: hypothetical protein EOP61_07355, partial [Sphingomonadales bacterium]